MNQQNQRHPGEGRDPGPWHRSAGWHLWTHDGLDPGLRRDDGIPDR